MTHTSLEFLPARVSCSLPSSSLEYSLVKPLDDYVITNPTNDLGLVDIEKEKLERRANEVTDPKDDRSLGNYGGYNHSINSYDFFLKDMPRSIALSSLLHYSAD